MPICFSFQTNLNLFKMNLDRGATYLFPCCNQHQSCFFEKSLSGILSVYFRYKYTYTHLFPDFFLRSYFHVHHAQPNQFDYPHKISFFQCLPCSTSATGFITLSSCQACTPPTGGRSELFFIINITFAQ